MYWIKNLLKLKFPLEVSRSASAFICCRQLHLEWLRKRTLLQLTGPDTADYLQSMVTNDVKKIDVSLDKNSTMYSMILNPTGRVLYDLILYKMSSSDYLVEYDATGEPYLHRHLLMYRLRKDVNIQPLSDMSIWAIYKNYEERPNSDDTESNIILKHLNKAEHIVQFAQDPRINSLGFRVLTKKNVDVQKALEEAGLNVTEGNSYTLLRYKLGVAEGVLDLPPGSCLPLDSNLDLLNGVSFTKGCYIGQEMAAKSNFVMSIRKRLMPIILEEKDAYPIFPPECNIVNEKKQKMGRLRSHHGQYGLALLKYEDCKKCAQLSLEGLDIKLEAVWPSWWPSNLSSSKNEHIFSL